MTETTFLCPSCSCKRDELARQGEMRIMIDEPQRDRRHYHKEFMQVVREMVDEYSPKNQLSIVKEELAELIVAISHLERGRKTGKMEVFTELADVEFMLEQLKYILRRDYGFTSSRLEAQKYFAAGMRVSPNAFKALDCDEAVANDQA